MAVDLFERTIAVALLSFVIAYLVNHWFIRGKYQWGQDHPNTRSLHQTPVPRLGGIGLFFGVITSWTGFELTLPLPITASMGILLAVSLLDDIRSLPVWTRLLVHGLVALDCSLFLFFPEYSLLTVMMSTAAIVWMVNLFNFMDGSDGLAGGMTVIGFGCYALMAYIGGCENDTLINISITSAAIGFLLHNFSPARIFLGDSGAIPLGFLAIVLGISGWKENLWPIWFPILIFSPFIVDATVTLMKRAFRGEKIWKAHREHYYQKMVQVGLGHRNTALCWYGLMLLISVSAIWATQQDHSIQQMTLLVWSFIYFVLLLFLEWMQALYSNRG